MWQLERNQLFENLDVASNWCCALSHFPTNQKSVSENKLSGSESVLGFHVGFSDQLQVKKTGPTRAGPKDAKVISRLRSMQTIRTSFGMSWAPRGWHNALRPDTAAEKKDDNEEVRTTWIWDECVRTVYLLDLNFSRIQTKPSWIVRDDCSSQKSAFFQHGGSSDWGPVLQGQLFNSGLVSETYASSLSPWARQEICFLPELRGGAFCFDLLATHEDHYILYAEIPVLSEWDTLPQKKQPDFFRFSSIDLTKYCQWSLPFMF